MQISEGRPPVNSRAAPAAAKCNRRDNFRVSCLDCGGISALAATAQDLDTARRFELGDNFYPPAQAPVCRFGLPDAKQCKFLLRVPARCAVL
jgi:hypothetical protein